MKKIELIIDASQSNELEYLISKFNIPFYKNELHVKDHLTRIQYMIFAPDTTRKIMKEIKNFSIQIKRIL